MFIRLLSKWAIKRQLSEANHFLEMLRVAEDSGLGLVVATAADYRIAHAVIGKDLSRPMEIASQYPTFVTDTLFEAKRRNAVGLPEMASGLMVWVHTLRSKNDAHIREQAQEIWSNLARGFPYVEEVVDDYFDATGRQLRIDGFEQFPEGFTPDPKARVQ